jgi:F0F1-type ATP synthase delta subunit
MAVRISHRKLARYYADSLLAGENPKKLAKKLAAYLIESGSTKQLKLIISDIEYQLSLSGTAIVDVTSAHELNENTKLAIINLTRRETDATNVQLREHLNPSVIGGVKLGFPGSELDMTIARRLTMLKPKCNRYKG